MKEQYNLKGQIKKVSNVMCELIITSDKYFFELIGENETKRYFQMAYDFVKDYQNLGEQYIVSANPQKYRGAQVSMFPDRRRLAYLHFAN